ncbi:PPE domain-containing protein [Amycolatopsis orientalis]|uniref:PPE domain-containing protein n=1 Tax=Amycolatopsis orientalis TaxID=31958 RepID=UPI0003F6247C|nr:PPE domain-containing protein [Amycolatopsis orientalis]
MTAGPLTAAQIYEQVTGGEGTGSLSEAQVRAYNLTKRHHERAQRLTALTQKTMAGWQGESSRAAADATKPVVEAALDDAMHLAVAQAAITSQMDAFGTAKNSVKPVPPQQPAPTAEDVVGILEGNGGYWDKVKSYQADSQHNIDTFSVYHSASTSNGDELPAQYAQLTDPGGTVTLDDGSSGKPAAKGFGDGSDGRDRGIGEPYRGPGTGEPVPGGPGTGGPNVGGPQPEQGGPRPGQSGPQPVQPGTHLPQPDDGTRANSYTPPQVNPVVPPAANADFGPTGKPINTFNQPGTLPPGYTPFGPGTGGTPGSPGGRTAGGPGSPGGYRSGVPGGPGGTGQPGPGGRSGTGAPGQPMGGRGTAGSAGAAGRGGANGMPMAPGAARGKGEEDKEKKAPAYLQNPDPDETFGGYIEKPMPPVIGEKKAQQ